MSDYFTPGVWEKAFEEAVEVPVTLGLGGPRIGRVTSVSEVGGAVSIEVELDEPETPRIRGNCDGCRGARYARPRDACTTPDGHYIGPGLRYVRQGGAWYPQEIHRPTEPKDPR